MPLIFSLIGCTVYLKHHLWGEISWVTPIVWYIASWVTPIVWYRFYPKYQHILKKSYVIS